MSQSFFIRASDASHQPRRGVHQHQHYEILIIQAGSGQHSVDYETYDVCANQVYFMRPGQVHEFSPDHGAKFYFIAFDKDEVMLNAPTLLHSFRFFQSFHCNAPVVVDEVDSLIEQMVNIQQELATPAPLQQPLISGLLTVLLIKMQRKFRQFNVQQVSEDNPLVTQFNRLIDSQNVTFRFVKEYANELHVSTTYLNDTIKKVTGQPASFWVHKKQVLNAKQLLNDKTLNFKTIASQLGFSDATHFARFFKSHTQQTPSMYRAGLGQ